MRVYDTIAQQLGQVCLTMLGAHMLVSLQDGLQFRIKGSKRVNLIQIILDPCDTYTVKCWKVETNKEQLPMGIQFRRMDWQLG